MLRLFHHRPADMNGRVLRCLFRIIFRNYQFTVKSKKSAILFAYIKKKQYICSEFPENKETSQKSFLFLGLKHIDYGKKRAIQITHRIESGRVTF